MINQGTTWIDVTDFLQWRGTMTGFQNIQFNISKQYLNDGRDVRFFVHDSLRRRFIPVDFDLEAISMNGIISIDNDSRGCEIVRIRQLMGLLVKRATKTVGISFKRTMHTQVISPFKSNDIVLVLGGIWHGTFADDISAAKKQSKFKFVHIVHDMIPVMTPAFVVEDLPKVFATYKSKIFRIADGLIINSQSSKHDAELFMRQQGIDIPPSVVFRIADEKRDVKPSIINDLDSEDFILMVGTIEARKNHMLLYYAYKQAAREGIRLPKLVIVGRRGWHTDDLQYLIMRDGDVNGLISLRSGISDSELAWLYENCLFTVWPSFYEGWGMPVAESLTYGKLCLTSDSSSMPEIAPNLTQFFSPSDPTQLLQMIVFYLNPSERIKIERRIKREYKPTTWNEMYNIISTFINKL